VRRPMSPELRLRIMQSIRSKNTKPERLLLTAARLAFGARKIVKHTPNLPGRPDIFVPSLHLALFCDGCLFHGCPKHCRIPSGNREYWTQKIRRNRARDRRVKVSLRRRGISAWSVWEHDCREADLSRLVARLTAIRKKVRFRLPRGDRTRH